MPSYSPAQTQDLPQPSRAEVTATFPSAASNASRQADLGIARDDDASWWDDPLGAVSDWLFGEDDPVARFWDAWDGASDAASRKALVFSACEDGLIDAVVAARAPETGRFDMTGGAEDLDTVLDYAQEHATVAAAGRPLAELGAVQANWINQLAQWTAEAEAAPGEEVTDDDLAAAQEANAADHGYITRPTELTWGEMDPAQREHWRTRGNRAIKTMVAVLAERHPELQIEEAHFALDFAETERVGALAYTNNEGVCHIGTLAVKRIEKNPGAIAHASDEYQAASDRYAYFEDEIATLVREHSFEAGCEGHGCKALSAESYLEALLPEFAATWAPDLLEPMLVGLTRRFELDPRVPPESVEMFRTVVASTLAVEL